MSGSTAEREAKIAAFLQAVGLGTELHWLPSDASTRRYARLSGPDGRPLILMDAPPTVESAPCGPEADAETRRRAGYNALARLAACRVDAFVGAATYLHDRGLSAPEVLAFDVEQGLAVIEDLGDALFARLVEAGADPEPLYAAAIDLLRRLHAEPAPEVLPVKGGEGWPLLTYDALALKTGADLFLEWWPKYSGLAQFSEDAVAEWSALWAQVQARGEQGASVFAHRDYHAENLLWLEDRDGLARIGLLDFQDAVRAHPAWDLLSLLQDARRDVEPELEQAMLARYLDGRPAAERAAFLSDYAGLAALNNARITGLFARLLVRDGKPRYRAFLPRMWRMLARNLDHPDMAGLKAWFERNVPAEARA
jgi:aminoglycoside/choline kinase family phosphotransferase